MTTTADKPRRWRTAARIGLKVLLAGVGLLAVGVLLLPTFLPESTLRRKVEEALSAQTRRAVTVDSATFGWGEGLEIRGLRIASGSDPRDAPLAAARRLVVQFDPIEAPAALAEGSVPLDSLRVEGLELWLILRSDGSWNVADLEPLKVRSAQVTDAVVHVDNRQAGRRLTLKDTSASLGELSATGQGYVNLAARTAGGRVLLTANLNSLDFKRPPEELAGSLKVEWQDVAWPEVAAALGAEPAVAGLVRAASGRVATTFGQQTWTAEGSVEAYDVNLGTREAPAQPIAKTVLGFQCRRTGADRPIEIHRLKFTAAGLDLAISGTLQPAAGPVPASESRPKDARRRPRAPPGPPVPDVLLDRYGLSDLSLDVTGGLVWAPLQASVPLLRDYAEELDALAGRADFTLHVRSTPQGPQVAGTVDLTHTLFAWADLLRKDANQTLLVELEGRLARDFRTVDVTHLDLVTDAGRLNVQARLPLDGSIGRGDPPADARVEAWTGSRRADGVAQEAGRAEARRAEAVRADALLALVPGLRRVLGPIQAVGPMTLRASVEPEPAAEGGLTWEARLRADLTETAVDVPGRGAKPAGAVGVLEATVEVRPSVRTADVQEVALRLGEAQVHWRGAALLRWPEGAFGDDAGPAVAAGPPAGASAAAPPAAATPVVSGAGAAAWTGAFRGTLAASAIEAAGAILAPDFFGGAEAPVRGQATLEVQADLAGGQVRGTVKADLEGLAVRLGPRGAARSGAAVPTADGALRIVGPGAAGAAARAGASAGPSASAGPAAAAKAGASAGPGAVGAAGPGAAGPGAGSGAGAGAAAGPGAATGPGAAADYFVKPAGEPASVQLNGVVTNVAAGLWGSHEVEGEAGVELAGLRLGALGYGQVRLEWLGAPGGDGAGGAGEAAGGGNVRVQLGSTSSLEVSAAAQDLGTAIKRSPALGSALAGAKVAGRASGRFLFSVRPTVLHVGGEADLTDADLEFGTGLRKPRGVPMEVDFSADAPPPRGQSLEVYVSEAKARLAQTVTTVKGRLRVAQPGSLVGVRDRARLVSLLEEMDVEARADWVHDPVLRAALPWAEPLYARTALEGLTTIQVALAGTPLRGKVTVGADATACRISGAEALVKPAGTPARVQVEARYGDAPGELALARLEVTLADSTARAHGKFLFDDPRLLLLAPPTTWTIHLEGRAPDAVSLASLFPTRLEDLKPAGGVTFRIQAAADAHGTQVEQCDLAFQEARLEWLGTPVRVDGPVSYDGQRLATEGLRLVAGESDVTLVAYLAQPDGWPTGTVFLRGRTLDLAGLQDLVSRTSERLASWAGAAAGAGPAGGAAGGGPAGAGVGVGGAGAGGGTSPTPVSEWTARRLQRLLGRAHVACEIEVERVALAVPQWATTYDLRGFRAEARLADRRLAVPRFRCELNEGTIGGEAALDFTGEVPVLSIAYDARGLHMADNLKPFIDTTFPGMQVSGTVSTRAVRTQRLTEGAFVVGRGETVLTDGLLEGPGAPEYVTRVLPGLALTQYRFHQMSNVFENRPNGDADNRMLFRGKEYDIYIFGLSKADGRIQYTMGVDLTASLDSPVISRTLDQGKLPLLTFTGRIVGNEFAEREVNYVLPHQFVYDVFIRRSLLLQLVRRLGEKEPPIERPPVVPTERDRGRKEG